MASTAELEAEILADLEENPDAYTAPVNDVITIDPETRTINIPASETLFGTEQEMNVERKYFKCPKIVGDNIDLSKHQIYITYVTAKDNTGTFLPEEEPGLYYCEDMAVDGDYITFSWLLSGNVLNNHGFIAFAVSAKHMDGEVLKTRWKTKPAVGTVLLTVPDGEAIVERYPDIITQLLDKMNAVEEIATPEAMQNYVDAYFGRNPVQPVQLDSTLTDPEKAAPANVVGELRGDLGDKINKPSNSDNNKFPRAKDGNVEWVEHGLPTDEQTASAVTNWLDEHPEATTTVQDGAITEPKIHADFLPYIKKDYVTPEMFGAVGDGVHDDTDAFERAYNESDYIICMPDKIYNFTRTINARSRNGVVFDGNNSHFKNFSIEIWMKDDSYENRGGTSLMWTLSKFRNMNLGSGFYDFEDKWNVPTITSGCHVECENIVMCGHMVLVAYTNTYLDRLYLKNIIYSMGNVVPETVKDYNTIMFVDPDGTLNKWNGNTAGDNWTFENVEGASFHKEGIDYPFGLVSLHGNNNAVFSGCINPTIFCGYDSTASVLDCHFEDLSGLYAYDKKDNLTGLKIIVERCYFHGISKYPLNNHFVYYNCRFDIRDSDNNKIFSSHGTNLLKSTDIRDCRISYYKNLNNSTDLEPPYANNYLSLGKYTSMDIGVMQSEGLIKSWENGSYTIDAFMKTLYGSNVYFKKKSATFEITENKKAFNVSIVNPLPCELDIYITTPIGEIYNAKCYLDKTATNISCKLSKSFYWTSIDGKRDNYKDAKLRPFMNTLELVDSIPNYTERTDVYCLSKGMYVSTEDRDVDSNYVRIASNAINKGSGF